MIVSPPTVIDIDHMSPEKDNGLIRINSARATNHVTISGIVLYPIIFSMYLPLFKILPSYGGIIITKYVLSNPNIKQ